MPIETADTEPAIEHTPPRGFRGLARRIAYGETTLETVREEMRESFVALHLRLDGMERARNRDQWPARIVAIGVLGMLGLSIWRTLQ
jgi:hypothetical protein